MFTLVLIFLGLQLPQAQAYIIPTAEEQFPVLASDTEAADAKFMQWMKNEQTNYSGLSNGLDGIANLQKEIDALGKQLQGMEQSDPMPNFASQTSLYSTPPAMQEGYIFDFQKPGYVDPVTRGNQLFQQYYGNSRSRAISPSTLPLLRSNGSI